MNNLKKQNRSPLLNALRKAFFIAKQSQKTNSASTDEWIEKFEQSKVQRRQFIGDIMKTGIVISAAGVLSACKKVADVTPAVQLPKFKRELKSK